jgi:hypothetical protein
MTRTTPGPEGMVSEGRERGMGDTPLPALVSYRLKKQKPLEPRLIRTTDLALAMPSFREPLHRKLSFREFDSDPTVTGVNLG